MTKAELIAKYKQLINGRYMVVSCDEVVDDASTLDEPAPMAWTTERPKVPGAYWWRPGKVIRGVVIHLHPSNLPRDRGEWAGPIPEPIEPEESSNKRR